MAKKKDFRYKNTESESAKRKAQLFSQRTKIILLISL